MTTTCEICGAPLVLLHTGVAVCSAVIEGGGEMHGKAIKPTPEQASAIKHAWAHRNLPRAVACKTIKASASTSPFYTTTIYRVDGHPGMFRRVKREKTKPAEGHVLAMCGCPVELIRWEDADAELAMPYTDATSGHAAIEAAAAEEQDEPR